MPVRWSRDEFPYLLASLTLHRVKTPLFAVGSGTGQRLRERLIVGTLLNSSGATRPLPKFDPKSLTFIIDGSIEEVFAEDIALIRQGSNDYNTSQWRKKVALADRGFSEGQDFPACRVWSGGD